MLLTCDIVEYLLNKCAIGYFCACSGERAISLGLVGESVEDMSTEYGDLRMSLEVVSSVDEAVNHIHKYGR